MPHCRAHYRWFPSRVPDRRQILLHPPEVGELNDPFISLQSPLISKGSMLHPRKVFPPSYSLLPAWLTVQYMPGLLRSAFLESTITFLLTKPVSFE